MNAVRYTLAAVLLALGAWGLTRAGTPEAVAVEPEEPAPTVIDLSDWSLEEKVGQLLVWGTPDSPGRVAAILEGRAVEGTGPVPLGGVFLRSKRDRPLAEVQALAEYLRHEAPGRSPPFLAADQEGGEIAALADGVRVAPAHYELGLLDPAGVYAAAKAMAEDTHAAGITMIFGPVVDVDGNPPNPVIAKRGRSFGPEARRTAEAGLAFGRALSESGILPVFKHFPGHGSALTDSHLELPHVGLGRGAWEAGERVPYAHILGSAPYGSGDAPAGVMVAHLAWPALTGDAAPTGFSRALVTEELRGRLLGDDGLIVSDDLFMRALTDPVEAAVRMRGAGIDLLLVSRDEVVLGRIHQTLVGAYARGELAMDELDDSVRRILRAKAWMEERWAPPAMATF